MLGSLAALGPLCWGPMPDLERLQAAGVQARLSVARLLGAVSVLHLLHSRH